MNFMRLLGYGSQPLEVQRPSGYPVSTPRQVMILESTGYGHAPYPAFGLGDRLGLIGEVSRGKKKTLRGTDPESYITLVYEDQRRLSSARMFCEEVIRLRFLGLEQPMFRVEALFLLGFVGHDLG